MKLKLTYERPAGRPVTDILVNSDASVTVGAVAEYIAAADPEGGAPGPGPLTLAPAGHGRSGIAPATRLVDSGILSGSTVRLVPAESTGSAAVAQVGAVVTVLSGPDQGREFPISTGSSIIGRDRSCEVRLDDPLVSRQHARINVGDSLEVVDLGSANGIAVGAECPERIVLQPGDTIALGDTVLAVRPLSQPGRLEAPSAVSFNRPPQVASPYEGLQLVGPEPPDPPRSQRFPILPLFAPLIMGLILYITTHSLASLVFVAMSPLLVVANAMEGRLSGRKSYKAALAQFRQDIADLVQEVQSAQDEERARRLEERPSAAAGCAAADTLGPLLWSRWPDLPGFGSVRIGIGRQPSRTKIELTAGRQNNRALWKELRDAIAPLSGIDGVPVVSDLAEIGALGVGGRREEALGVARGLLLQLGCLHSPAELVMVALVSSQSGPAWDWIKWLPHCLSSQNPITGGPLVSSEPACAAMLAELEALVAERESQSDQRDVLWLPLVVVLVEDDAPVVRSSLIDLVRRGRAAGVHFVWVASEVNRLPAVCRVFVEVVPQPGENSVGFVHEGSSVTPLEVELVSEAAAERSARRLSSVVDSAASDDSQSDLPRSVSLLSLVGRDLASNPEAVVDRWNESLSLVGVPMAVRHPGKRRRPGTLRAIVGETVAGPHVLDLRAHGPHALVGGTTGSGKSELLQSWILGMALSNSPQRVTFLLVDYKGGSAFSECLHLPHTVGLVTDLSPHLVQRALTSLSAELKYREDLLHRKRAKDLVELERNGDPDAPPSLVIVVDEFAALVQEVPEFVDGVVNVAQRGRSLGLHLILATQRPAGVIKDNLRANTNLRLALRVADEADSTDVLGASDAAAFDPSIPGRALSRTGPSQLVPFQAAYAGGWTAEKPAAPSIEVASFGFASRVVWEAPEDPEELHADPGPTDIRRLVASVKSAHGLAQIPDPRLPWLPELAPLYDLARLPTRRSDAELVFAVADDPENQAQPVVSFSPDTDGNLAVYGTGNSGKSTLLRSLAVAAGLTVRGGPCRVYGLDFGSRGMAMLEVLPHVGSIIAGSDDERVGRLFRLLRETIDERAARYSRVGAGTITSYREISGEIDEPRILLLLDGMAAFRTAYEGTEHNRLFEMFLAIAADGRPVGVHVILSADRPGALPIALGAQVQRRIALRMADPNDYSTLGLPMDVLSAASPPGRGLLDVREIQVAVLGKSADVATQARELARFAQSMRDAGVSDAPPVSSLPEKVFLDDLPKEVGGSPVLGLSGVTLDPVGFEARGTFTVAGPPGSGRTSTLMAVVRSLQRAKPEARVFFFGNRRSPLGEIFEWERKALDMTEAGALAGDLPALVGEALTDSEVAVVVIEGIMDFLNGPAELALQEMVKALVGAGHLVVSDGDPTSLAGSYPLLAAARSSRSGIVLQPEQADAVIFRAQFGRLRRVDFPVGRGLFVPRGGQPQVVQVALP